MWIWCPKLLFIVVISCDDGRYVTFFRGDIIYLIIIEAISDILCQFRFKPLLKVFINHVFRQMQLGYLSPFSFLQTNAKFLYSFFYIYTFRISSISAFSTFTLISLFRMDLTPFMLKQIIHIWKVIFLLYLSYWLHIILQNQTWFIFSTIVLTS